jgi:valyl-tRNA synthetase
MAGSRNFATKLWNAARFTLSQIEEKGALRSLEGRVKSLPDRWILSRLNGTAQAVNRHLAAFRFDEAAQAIYAFLWHELCDGYLEMVKPLLSAGRATDGGSSEPAPEGAEDAKETARGVLARCLADSLALLHPFMPFVTEEIWEKMTGESGTLIVAAYPQGDPALADEPAEKVVEALRAVVTRVRNFRTDGGFSPTEPVSLAIDPDSPDRALAGEIATLAPLLRHMARLSDLAFATPGPEMGRDVLQGLSVGLSVARSGVGTGTEKLARTLVALAEEIASLSEARNTSFLDSAAPVVTSAPSAAELEERRSALSTAGA